ADIVGVDSTQTVPLVQQDYIYALDDLMDLETTKMSQAIRDLGTIGDKMYLFTNNSSESGGMFYNKTMFEQAGPTDPAELQESGEWTWEAMLEAAKKLTTGTNFGLSGSS